MKSIIHWFCRNAMPVIRLRSHQTFVNYGDSEYDIREGNTYMLSCPKCGKTWKTWMPGQEVKL